MILRVHTLSNLQRHNIHIPVLMMRQRAHRVHDRSMHIKNVRTQNNRHTISTRIILILLSKFHRLLRNLMILSIVNKLSRHVAFNTVVLSSLLIMSSTMPFNNMQRNMQVTISNMQMDLTNVIRRFRRINILRQFSVLLMLNRLIRTNSIRRN